MLVGIKETVLWWALGAWIMIRFLKPIGSRLVGILTDWLLVETLAIDFLKAPYWDIYLDVVRLGITIGTSIWVNNVFLKVYFDGFWRAELLRTSSILSFTIFLRPNYSLYMGSNLDDTIDRVYWLDLPNLSGFFYVKLISWVLTLFHLTS